MKKINRKTYYITMLLGIINNNILTCMEDSIPQDSNSQNIINTNIPALSLCSTNNDITIKEKNVDQQVIEPSEKYNDILIETLRDNLNNILKEGQYDFKSIMETFQNLGEKIFIPFVQKLIEKENFDKEKHIDKEGEIKYVVVKGEDWLGYEKKGNIFFYGHYKKEFDKVGVEINYEENSVFYGFWVNREKLLSKKFLGVEFNKEGCFIGVYDDTKEKKTNGLYIKPGQIEIITQTFEPCIISKKNFNIDNLKKIDVKSKIEDNKKYIENIKNVGFYLAKLQEAQYNDIEYYSVRDFQFLNNSEIKEQEIIESHKEKANAIGWTYKYPGIEKKEIITSGETFLYNNDEIGVALCIVFDKEGIYNVRIEKKNFNDKKEKKKKRIYFIRDNIFQLEQEKQDSSELRRYNIYLAPREQDSTWVDILNKTWVDILNKKNQEKKFDLFFESYSISDFKHIATEKRLSKNICIFKNGTFMYKEPFIHLSGDPKARKKETKEIHPCTLVNDFNKTYENGRIFCRINEKDLICCFLKENYERQEKENCFKTDEDGKIKILSNGEISVNIKKSENFTVYSYTKNEYEYNIYVKNNEIVKIIIFEDENVTILYPQEKNFSKINNKIEDSSESQNIIKSDDESDKENDNEKNEINYIPKTNYSDDESDNEETDDKKQEKLYEEICKTYGLQDLCEIINKTQDLQSKIKGNGIKYLLPGKEIIDKTEKEIIDKNVIKQKISKKKKKKLNKIDIKEEIKSEEENILKIYTLKKGEKELNKKVKNSENSWNIKKKKKNNITKENFNNKVDNPNDNLHKNNDDYFFSESDCLEFKNDIFFGEKTTKNYVVQDWKDTKHDKFINTLKEKKIYKQYCDLLNILIFDPFSFFKKKLQGHIFEAKLNDRYRLYLKKIDKNLYRIDNNGKNKQEVAKFFFLLHDNIEHIKYKKNQ